MPHTRRVNTLSIRPIHRARIPALGIIRSRARRAIIVISKHTRPLLHRLLVVIWQQRGVCGAVVDLHLGARAVVAGVHVEDDLGPFLWRCC